MPELTVTPRGHLLLRDTPPGGPERTPPAALLDAFRESAARGMLDSANASEAALPAPFEFARAVARLYFAEFCKAAAGHPASRSATCRRHSQTSTGWSRKPRR